MWKAALAGTLIAVFAIATFLTIGCATIFEPAVCAIDRTRTSQTVKSAARHAYYLSNGVPEAYRGRHNPFKATIGNFIEGARLYDLNCAVCHGAMGVGDGVAREKLDVPPADLGASLAQPLNSDDYFYWTMADGGSRFGSDMPPFRTALTDPQIWKIIIFMRAAFAESGPKPAVPAE